MSKNNTKLINKVKFSIKSKFRTAEDISGLLNKKYDQKTLLNQDLGFDCRSEYHIWEMCSINTQQIEIEVLIEDVLDRIEPLVGKIQKLPKDCELLITCEVKETEEPEYVLTPDLMKRLVAINATLWIDQYITPDAENDDEDWVDC